MIAYAIRNPEDAARDGGDEVGPDAVDQASGMIPVPVCVVLQRGLVVLLGCP